VPAGLHRHDAAVADLDGAVGDHLAGLGDDARMLQGEVARRAGGEAFRRHGALLGAGEAGCRSEDECGGRTGETGAAARRRRVAHR
jgi:hypothetical protein